MSKKSEIKNMINKGERVDSIVEKLKTTKDYVMHVRSEQKVELSEAAITGNYDKVRIIEKRLFNIIELTKRTKDPVKKAILENQFHTLKIQYLKQY